MSFWGKKSLKRIVRSGQKTKRIVERIAGTTPTKQKNGTSLK